MGRNPKKDVLKLNYRKGGRSVSEVWKKMKKEYISGGVTYKDLHEKYGVPESTLRKVGAREHWSDLRNFAYARTEQKVVEAVSARNARLDDAVDLALNAVFDLFSSGAGLRATDIKEVTVALKNLRDLKGLKNEADAEEQRARIEALRARAAASKANEEDEENGGGVIMLSTVDEAPKEAEGNE
jgi:hypothetical protein